MKKNKKIGKGAAKRAKSITKTVIRKARPLLNKSKKGAVKTIKAFQKEWKKEQPQREKYIKDIKRISGDVLETIVKDLKEIRAAKKRK